MRGTEPQRKTARADAPGKPKLDRNAKRPPDGRPSATARPSDAERVPAAETQQVVIAADQSRTPKFARSGSANLTLPEKAEGILKLTDKASGMQVTARLLGASSKAATALDGYLVYEPSAGTSSPSVVHRPTPDGSEEYLLYEAAPATQLRYEVQLSEQVAALRLIYDSVEFLAADGSPRLRANTPYAWTPDGDELALSAHIEGCAYDSSPAPPWGRVLPSPGARTCTLRTG